MNYLIDRELFENYSEFEDEYEWEDKQKGGFLSKLGKGKAAAVGAMMRILNLINPLPEPAIPPKPVPTETRRRKPSGGQGEFEWELEAEIDRVRSRDAELMEYLGRAATETESEAEAAAFIGALIPIADRIISSTKPVLTRNSPALMRGLVAATQALRRHPDTRPLVRTIPTIVRRTAASMNQQLRQGMPVTQKTALQSLARQAQALLSSPQQSIQALQRSQGVIPHHRNFVVKNRLEDELELEIALQEIEHMAGSRKSNPKPKTWPTPPPKINVGEIKPDTPSGRKAGRTELNSRGNMKGNEAIVLYDPSGNLRMEVTRAKDGTVIWSGPIGQVDKKDMPKGSNFGSGKFGTDIEAGTREKVGSVTNQSFKDKHGNAGGADLIPV